MADKEIIVFPSKEETKYGDTGEMEEHTDRRGNKTMIKKWGDIPQGYCPLFIRKNVIPNRFFYAVPEELVDKVKDLVPKYAGLISVSPGYMKEIKPAPLLHKRKSFETLKGILLDKFYWAYISKANELTAIKRDLKIQKFYYEPEEFEENITTTQLTIF